VVAKNRLSSSRHNYSTSYLIQIEQGCFALNSRVHNAAEITIHVYAGVKILYEPCDRMPYCIEHVYLAKNHTKTEMEDTVGRYGLQRDWLTYRFKLNMYCVQVA
jgi:hypothetical protein